MNITHNKKHSKHIQPSYMYPSASLLLNSDAPFLSFIIYFNVDFDSELRKSRSHRCKVNSIKLPCISLNLALMLYLLAFLVAIYK